MTTVPFSLHHILLVDSDKVKLSRFLSETIAFVTASFVRVYSRNKMLLSRFKTVTSWLFWCSVKTVGIGRNYMRRGVCTHDHVCSGGKQATNGKSAHVVVQGKNKAPSKKDRKKVKYLPKLT